MQEIIGAIVGSGKRFVLPLHPRTRKNLTSWGMIGTLERAGNVILTEPQSFMAFTALEQNAEMIMTDSGGVQKEAYFFAVPCVTLRPETEWVETVQTGWNRLAWGDAETVLAAARGPWPGDAPPPVFGDGRAAERIAALWDSQGG